MVPLLQVTYCFLGRSGRVTKMQDTSLLRRKGYRSVREAVVFWGAFFIVSMTTRLWAHFADYSAAASIALVATGMIIWIAAGVWWFRLGRQRFTLPANGDATVEALD